jgi:hypothetical protein
MTGSGQAFSKRQENHMVMVLTPLSTIFYTDIIMKQSSN